MSVEFDTLFRLGNQKIEPETLEVLFDKKWYTVISVYASAAGGRIWIRAGEELASFSFKEEEMIADDPSGRLYNIGVKDNKILGFRGPKGLVLATDEEMEEWGIHRGTDFRADLFPPCAESRVVTASSPEAAAVDKPVGKSSRANAREDAEENVEDEDAEENVEDEDIEEDEGDSIAFSLGGDDD